MSWHDEFAFSFQVQGITSLTEVTTARTCLRARVRGRHLFERSVKQPSCSAGRRIVGSSRALATTAATSGLTPLGVLQELEIGLAQIGQTLDDAAAAPKTIHWKLQLAYRLRQASAAPYSWIAKTLRMGAASSVRAALSRRLQQPAG